MNINEDILHFLYDVIVIPFMCFVYVQFLLMKVYGLKHPEYTLFSCYDKLINSSYSTLHFLSASSRDDKDYA